MYNHNDPFNSSIPLHDIVIFLKNNVDEQLKNEICEAVRH